MQELIEELTEFFDDGSDHINYRTLNANTGRFGGEEEHRLAFYDPDDFIVAAKKFKKLVKLYNER